MELKILLLFLTYTMASPFNPFLKKQKQPETKINNMNNFNPFANSNSPFGKQPNNGLLPEIDNNLKIKKPTKPIMPIPVKPINPFLPQVDKKKLMKKNRMKALKALQEVSNINDFLTKFPAKEGMNARVTVEDGKASILIQHRSLTSTGESTTVVEQLPFATAAECAPRPKTRDVSHLANYSGIIYPSCITYNQCGGCCFNHDHQKCVPDTVEERRVQIFRINLQPYGWEPVAFTYYEHKSCKCDCRVEPKDCIGQQVHRDCQCHCPSDAKKDCPKNKQWSEHYCGCRCSNTDHWCPSGKKWDENNCGCVCNEKETCAKGKIWDEASCRCVISSS